MFKYLLTEKWQSKYRKSVTLSDLKLLTYCCRVEYFVSEITRTQSEVKTQEGCKLIEIYYVVILIDKQSKLAVIKWKWNVAMW